MPRTAKGSVIELDNVSKSIKSNKILNGVSFKVQKGEVFGLLGLDGSGKSTAIRIILNVLKPSSGEVKLFGQSSKKTRHTHARIGYLSEGMVIDEDLSGMQYLSFVDHLYGGGNGARTLSLAKIFGVNLRQKIGRSTPGDKQKIGLIAAVLHRPELLIFDEPTSEFDPIMKEKFLSLVSDFRDRGGTVLMTSHDLGEVEKVCDRVALMRDGEIVATKTLASFKHQTTKRVEVFAGKQALDKLLINYKKVTNLSLFRSGSRSLGFTYGGDIKKLLRYLAVQDITDVVIEQPDLEDVFIDYYTSDSDQGDEVV